MSTTMMTAKSSTTDSEMATTDHTLGRNASAPAAPAREPSAASPQSTIVPPTAVRT
ncbi:hypothetical protein GCM10010420_11310 [Streptomyces glaucosporus]|uniref:Uncharacterized protein n=1 Tax=Streptomyces glaucosporus TaxID=284044 RepID=A0ABP5UWT0_9ACTN